MPTWSCSEIGRYCVSRKQSCSPEFAQFECRFRDCSHLVEPGCGVREAVESGALPFDRWDAYRRLHEGKG